jgi:nitroimidazol reductase NimA-like FMN-containing flavoprotein (pyridoxamine 5'-phosphate oxidase superfamily)
MTFDAVRALDLVGGTEVMSVAACWELLGSVAVGHIAVSTQWGIDLFPVNFRVEDGRIVFATNFGRKLVGLADGESVFEAERIDERTRTGSSVVVRGAAEISEHPEGWDWDRPWTGAKRYAIRLTPTSITGRRTRSCGF